jgi:hypothetical protein
VRLVFGASPALIGRAVIAQVTRLTLPGLVVGLVIVAALRGVLKTFVFGIAPTSSAVRALAGGALLSLALLAALPSALRAMRVDVRRGLSGS